MFEIKSHYMGYVGREAIAQNSAAADMGPYVRLRHAQLACTWGPNRVLMTMAELGRGEKRPYLETFRRVEAQLSSVETCIP